MTEDESDQGNNTVRATFVPFLPVGESGASSELLSESLGLRRKVTKAEGDPGPSSKQIFSEQQFSKLAEAGKIIEPPFDLDNLTRIPEESAIINQCIEVMQTNVDGFGWDLEYVGPKGSEEANDVRVEKERISDLLESINPRESFMSLRKKFRRDYESTGNGYFEVIRSLNDEIKWLEHLPASTVRLAPLDKDPQKVTVRILSSSGKVIEKECFVQFRRYVQVVDRKKVWFKEFGDKRIVKASDGKNADDGLPIEERANELIHYRQFSSRTPYGIPRYIGNLPSIRGGRMSEIIDVRYFERNAIPQMAVLVSGGGLSKESFEQLTKTFSQSGGLKNFWGVMVLEAVSSGAGAVDEKGAVKIEMKSLQGDRLEDAQFLKYKETCLRNSRSAWRLPPLHCGLTEEYSYAVAQAARVTAEEQVFIPERRTFDEVINLQLFRDMGIKYWLFYSKGPSISDMRTYIQAIESFNTVGAMTPNIAITLASELLDIDMPRVEQPWADLPFGIVERLAEQGRLAGLGDAEREGTPLPGLLQKLNEELGSDGSNGSENARACVDTERNVVIRELARKIDVLLRTVREREDSVE